MTTENTYWNHEGTYPAAVQKLQALIPHEGPVNRKVRRNGN